MKGAILDIYVDHFGSVQSNSSWILIHSTHCGAFHGKAPVGLVIVQHHETQTN